MRTMDMAIQQLLDAGLITGAEAYRKAINKAKFEAVKDAEAASSLGREPGAAAGAPASGQRARLSRLRGCEAAADAAARCRAHAALPGCRSFGSAAASSRSDGVMLLTIAMSRLPRRSDTIRCRSSAPTHGVARCRWC